MTSSAKVIPSIAIATAGITEAVEIIRLVIQQAEVALSRIQASLAFVAMEQLLPA
jgi:hypothetical protein